MGRVLALDSGTVRIGVAVSDPLRITAQPHSVLDADSPDLMTDIAHLVESLDVERIVVGLPVSLDGTEGASALLARDLAGRITEAIGVEVSLIDERFSTVIAERVMIQAGARRSKRRATQDRVAAAVFLQAYLDGMR